MKRIPRYDQAAVFEGSSKKPEQYLLRLYVTGTTPKSVQAIRNLKQICETHLRGRYVLEGIDIYQQSVLAKGEQIVAAPTLIKYLPSPFRRMIGTMSNHQRVLLGLDLKPGPEKQAHESHSERTKSSN